MHLLLEKMSSKTWHLIVILWNSRGWTRERAQRKKKSRAPHLGRSSSSRCLILLSTGRGSLDPWLGAIILLQRKTRTGLECLSVVAVAAGPAALRRRSTRTRLTCSRNSSLRSTTTPHQIPRWWLARSPAPAVTAIKTLKAWRSLWLRVLSQISLCSPRASVRVLTGQSLSRSRTPIVIRTWPTKTKGGGITIIGPWVILSWNLNQTPSWEWSQKPSAKFLTPWYLHLPSQSRCSLKANLSSKAMRPSSRNPKMIKIQRKKHKVWSKKTTLP